MKYTINVSLGEIIDKLTILEIKKEKIHPFKFKDKFKLVQYEYMELEHFYLTNFKKLQTYYKKLKKINSILWILEDDIRDCIKNNNYNEKFIKISKNIAKYNDYRYKVKQSINILFNCKIQEVKHYKTYENNSITTTGNSLNDDNTDGLNDDNTDDDIDGLNDDDDTDDNMDDDNMDNDIDGLNVDDIDGLNGDNIDGLNDDNMNDNIDNSLNDDNMDDSLDNNINENKTNSYKVYTINLDKCISKYNDLFSKFKEYSKFKFCRFKAQTSIDFENYNRIKLNTNLLKSGQIGCAFSHYKLWKKCIEDNLDYIFIAEDDIDIYNNFDDNNIIETFNEIIKTDRDWDIFFMSRVEDILHNSSNIGNEYNLKPLIDKYIINNTFENKNYKQISPRCGLHFYVISKKCCKNLISNIEKSGLYAPIDVQIWYNDISLKAYQLKNGYVIESYNVSDTSNVGLGVKLKNEYNLHKLLDTKLLEYCNLYPNIKNIKDTEKYKNINNEFNKFLETNNVLIRKYINSNSWEYLYELYNNELLKNKKLNNNYFYLLNKTKICWEWKSTKDNNDLYKNIIDTIDNNYIYDLNIYNLLLYILINYDKCNEQELIKQVSEFILTIDPNNINCLNLSSIYCEKIKNYKQNLIFNKKLYELEKDNIEIIFNYSLAISNNYNKLLVNKSDIIRPDTIVKKGIALCDKILNLEYNFNKDYNSYSVNYKKYYEMKLKLLMLIIKFYVFNNEYKNGLEIYDTFNNFILDYIKNTNDLEINYKYTVLLGDINYGISNLEDSIKYFNDSLEINKLLTNTSNYINNNICIENEINIYIKLSKAYIYLRDNNSALTFINKSISLSKYCSTLLYYKIYTNYGNYLLFNNNYNEGLKYYNFIIYNSVNNNIKNIPIWNKKDVVTKLLISNNGGFGDSIMLMKYIPHFIKYLISNNITKSIIISIDDKLFYLFNKMIEEVKKEYANDIMNNKIDITFVYETNYIKNLLNKKLNYDIQNIHRIDIMSIPELLNFSYESLLKTNYTYYLDYITENNYFNKLITETNINSIVNNDLIYIGFNWHGNRDNFMDNWQRSIPLDLLLNLFKKIYNKNNNFRFINIQKNYTEDEKELLTNDYYNKFIINPNEDFDNNKLYAFKDTISIMKNCKYIISTDTSILHLAGNMHKNVIGLITYSPEWRWGKSNSCCWYPNMKIIRQTSFKNWIDSLDELESYLIT